MNSGLPSVGFFKTAELYLLKIALPADTEQCDGERMLAVHFGVAVGADQQNRIAGDEMSDVTQHRYRPAVRPMQVVQDEYEGRPARNRDSQLRYRIEQPHPLLFLVEGGGSGTSPRRSFK